MGSAVYVWPLHMLGGLYADLQAGNVTKGTFDFDIIRASGNGEVDEKMAICLDVRSSLSSNGRISILVAGECFSPGSEVAQSTVLAVFEALRTDYGIFFC